MAAPSHFGQGFSQHQTVAQAFYVAPSHPQGQQPTYGGAPRHGPPPPRPAAADGRLRSVEELPACFRPVFPFRFFNAIQNDCWPTIYESGCNVVVAAPTGAGKTVLLELAILRQLSRNIAPGSGGAQFAHKPGHLKAVYLAPSRALVQEKVRDWGQRFEPLGLAVRELTGDTDQEDLAGLDTADIICATPEKFDAVTRNGMRFFADIGLVLIDEVHLLNENRGSSLEGVVSRVKMVSRVREMREQAIGSVRFVAVSATIPNLQDLAEWLHVPPAGIKCFGEEMRPVKLRTVVRGYNPTKTDFLFERRLNDFIYQIVEEHSSGKPSLVFCSSRKGTTDTAAQLAKEAAKAAAFHGAGGPGGGGGGGRCPSAYVRDSGQLQRLQAAAAGLRDGQLRECVCLGVGFHHAALEPGDREAVEALFVAQDLPVLCTTSTLAMGVNLPARLVVLKGTRRYVGSEAEDASGYSEYERSTALQMVGRAGRPQFDTEGVAVIMTQKAQVRRYEELINGSELVESTLKDVLPEFLNAEITLRTIGDVSQAVEWLRCTYFYVRAKRNPQRYGVPRQLGGGPEALDRWLRDKLVLGVVGELAEHGLMSEGAEDTEGHSVIWKGCGWMRCLGVVGELAEHGLVRLQDDGFGLEPLQPGQIMAERYIRVKTMASLGGAPAGAGMPDLLAIVAKSVELSNIKLRRSEKKILNEINHSEGMHYPLMAPSKPGKVLERISTGPDKIFILINEGLSDSPSDKLDYSLKQDVEQALNVGRRIAGAMVKYFEHTGRAAETFNALLLSKSLRQRLWTDSRLETRQLSGIGPLIAQRLAGQGLTKLSQLAEVEPRRLESLAQRHFPFGNEVHAALTQCLPPAISLKCMPVAWLPGGLVELEITVERTGDSAARSPARLLVGSLHDDALLLCRSLALESFPSPLVLRARTRTPVKGRGKSVEVVASVVHERLVGVDTAVRTVVPPGVELQGQRFQPAPKPVPAAAAEAQQAQQGGGKAASGRLAAGGKAGKVEAELEAGGAGMQPSSPAAGGDAAGEAAQPAVPPVQGALKLMQRRMGGPEAGSQVGGQAASALPAPPRMPLPPGCSEPAVAAAIPAAAAAVPAVAGSQAAAGAGGKGRWLSFVETGKPSAAAPTAAPSAPQQRQQQQLAGTFCDGKWQQQAPGLRRPFSAFNTQQPGLGPAPPPTVSSPADLAAAGGFGSRPGGLFGRFALGSGWAAAGPAGGGSAPQEGRSGSVPPPAQLQAVTEAGQASFEAAEDAAAKRRRMNSSSPGRLGFMPAAAAAAPAEAERPAPAQKVLQLPKLAWLSGRFGGEPAGSAAVAAPAPTPKPAAGPPAVPDQAEQSTLSMFDSFL